MVKWHKTRSTYRYSPLNDPSHLEKPPTSNPEGRREIIFNNLLSRTAEVGDIPTNSPTVSRCSLPFPKLTAVEIQNSFLHAGDTVPGVDEIPTAIIKHSWPHIKILVQTLFKSCLSLGHHPKYFRLAILAMIQKLNKSDLSSLIPIDQ